jgi:CheY-like chemotaxis protein
MPYKRVASPPHDAGNPDGMRALAATTTIATFRAAPLHGASSLPESGRRVASSLQRFSRCRACRRSRRYYHTRLMSDSPALGSDFDATRPLPDQSLRILLADDDRDATLSLATLLKLEGYEVRQVYDGAAALAAVREFEPDIVLVDIGMPKLSGYDVARQLRERHGKDGPLLVALTAWKQASDRILATLAGFDYHVAKPYDPRALLELIRELERQRDRRLAGR